METSEGHLGKGLFFPPAEKVKPRRLKRNGWRNKRKNRRFLPKKIQMSLEGVINNTICCIKNSSKKMPEKYPLNFFNFNNETFIYTNEHVIYREVIK